jgi:hypothetical protein
LFYSFVERELIALYPSTIQLNSKGMIALPHFPKSQDKYDSLSHEKNMKCHSWFSCCCQSGSKTKIRAIYADQRKDNSGLPILTKSIQSTCESPTPTEEIGEIFSATPWLKDVSHLNSDISHQICLTVLVTFYEVAKLECETVRIPDTIVGESLTEIQSIISGLTTVKLEELPQKLEKLIENISKLELKAHSEEKDISNPIDGSESTDSYNVKKLKEVAKILSMKTQLRKLNRIKSESERDRKLHEVEDKSSLDLPEIGSLKCHQDLECHKVDALNSSTQRKEDGDEVKRMSQMLHTDLQKQLRTVNSDISDEKKADLVQLYLKYLRSELDSKEIQ